MRMVERYADAALDDLMAMLVHRRSEIRAMLIDRMSTLGIDEYGDRTWHLPDDACAHEAMQELADGGFYLTPPRARAAGDAGLRCE